MADGTTLELPLNGIINYKNYIFWKPRQFSWNSKLKENKIFISPHNIQYRF